jgi:hypothetical protein
MARHWRWEEPVQLSASASSRCCTTIASWPSGVSRSGTHGTGTIDFGVCASVQPAPGDYLLRLASGAEHVVTIVGCAPAPRMAVRLTLGVNVVA